MRRIRHGGLHAVVVWQWDAAAAQIRSVEARDTLVERSVPSERRRSGNGLEGRVQHERIAEVTAERFLRPQPAGVERGAVAAAEHRFVVEAIDGAEPRRKPVLRRLQAHVLRVAANAADQDIERLQVHYLDLPIGTPEDRVVLPPQPEIERELVVRRPAIAEEHRMLPLAGREQLVLETLAGRADEAEQERRVLVVEIPGLRSRAERSRRVPGEVEASTRVGALRLPVVEVQEIAAVASLEVMTADDLGHVAAEGDGLLLPPGRAPGRRMFPRFVNPVLYSGLPA